MLGSTENYKCDLGVEGLRIVQQKKRNHIANHSKGQNHKQLMTM